MPLLLVLLAGCSATDVAEIETVSELQADFACGIENSSGRIHLTDITVKNPGDDLTEFRLHLTTTDRLKKALPFEIAPDEELIVGCTEFRILTQVEQAYLSGTFTVQTEKDLQITVFNTVL